MKILRFGIAVVILTVFQSVQGYDQHDLGLVKRLGSCPGCDLRGADLIWLDLRGKRFDSARLAGARFTSTRLVGAEFVDADLSGVNLSNKDLSGTDFTRAILDGVDLTESILTGAKFSWARLTGAKVGKNKIVGADFRGAVLDQIDLSGKGREGYHQFCQIIITYLLCLNRGISLKKWFSARLNLGWTMVLPILVESPQKKRDLVSSILPGKMESGVLTQLQATVRKHCWVNSFQPMAYVVRQRL